MFGTFVTKKLVGLFVLPPSGPLLVTIFGLLVAKRSPRLGRSLAWLGVVALFLLSTPVVNGGLNWLLYSGGPVDLNQARQAQAIVILGGGLRHGALEYGGDTLGRLTLDRVRYGARLARQTELPVLVTGGSIGGGPAEADVMAQALEEEFGIIVRWRESESSNTHQNARFSAAILKRAGVEHVLLVSHGFDVPRAMAEFEAAGIRVIPAPTQISDLSIDSPLDLIPNVHSLQGSYYACYELLAGAARALGI
jgi:uncharacterized SAM-binding protein YcdF (DUF218 family)